MGRIETTFMMTPARYRDLDDKLSALASWLLIALCLLVPIFSRQPVNTLAALFALVVSTRLLITARLRRAKLDVIDWAMVALLFSALLSTSLGWRSPSGRMQGVAEAIALFTVFYGIRHGGYDEAWRARFAAAAITGAVMAALFGLALYLSEHHPFALPGIPATIRSALYLGIAMCLVVGFALAKTGFSRFVSIVAAVFLFVMVLFLHSRAVTMAIALSLLLGFAFRFRMRAFGILMALVAMMFVTTTIMPKDARVAFDAKTTEFVELVTKGKVSANDQLRIDGWLIALAWLKKGDNFLLGIGPRNYSQISTVRDTLPLPRQVSDDAWRLSHAHNMFLTRYVEQGFLGLAALLLFLVPVARRLVSDGLAGNIHWTWWGAWGGLLLPILNGLVGSPWNHEYVWLAVLCFALYLSWREQDGSSRPS